MVFSCFFFDTNLIFDVYIGSIYILQGWGRLCWLAVTKTGPNDASGIVWAICNNTWFFLVFFFDTNLLFDVYIGSIYILQGRGGLRWVVVTKKGPKRCICVVWAIGMFFLKCTIYFLSFYYYETLHPLFGLVGVFFKSIILYFYF